MLGLLLNPRLATARGEGNKPLDDAPRVGDDLLVGVGHEQLEREPEQRDEHAPAVVADPARRALGLNADHDRHKSRGVAPDPRRRRRQEPQQPVVEQLRGRGARQRRVPAWEPRVVHGAERAEHPRSAPAVAPHATERGPQR
jgi:hypothetical protein